MAKRLQPGELLRVICDNGIYYADIRYLRKFYKDHEEKEISIPKGSLVILLERKKLEITPDWPGVVEVSLLWENRKVYAAVPMKYFWTWFKRVEKVQ